MPEGCGFSNQNRKCGEGIIYYTEKRTGLIKDAGLGLIHIYYGHGVGKTTSAVGLAIRAAGQGLRVYFIQFMKSGHSGETSIFEKIPNIRYQCPGKHPFILSRGPEAVHYKHAEKALGFAFDAIEEGAQLLICDEILDTVLFKVLSEERLTDLMRRCRKRVELVMTGRYASEEIKGLADYAAELLQVKHPYYSGAKARKGIEY